MLLAQHGADVVTVARPSTIDDGPALALDATAAGRPTLTLDLRAAADSGAFGRLVDAADVLIEGFRPGVAERLGIGPDACLDRNPRLVYGRVTGWGREGPLAATAGHDLTYLATTGALAAIGRRDGPPAPPLNLVGDYAGGAQMLAFGIVAALVERQSSGRGQVVDTAMVDGVASLMTSFYGLSSLGAWRDARGSNLLDSGAPFYDCYRTADDRWVAVAALEGRFFAELVDLLGLADDAVAARQYDEETWPAMRRRFAEVFASRTRDEWAGLAADRDVCLAPVLGLAEAPRHPHHVARGTFVEDEGVVRPDVAPRLGRTPGRLRPLEAAPDAVDDLLRRWGVDQTSREVRPSQ